MKIINRIVSIIGFLFAIVVGWAVFRTVTAVNQPSGGLGEATLLAHSPTCTANDVSIKSYKVEWIDKCRVSPCIYMQGAGVLTNKCRTPLHIQIKMIGYDKTGNPITVREFYPASINAISTGDYAFSLDQVLDYSPDIKAFSLDVSSVR